MPSAWIQHEGGLKAFQGGKDLASSIAALKIYLLLCLQANDEPTAFVGAGQVQVTYSQIMEWADLARATVVKGINKLQAEGLIEVEEVRGRNVYSITNYVRRGGWCLLPRALGDGLFVRAMSARKALHLNALKLYMALLTFRANRTPYALLGYDRIEEHTGIRRNDILRAISVLVAHGLVVVDRGIQTVDQRNPPNHYFMCQLGYRVQNRAYQEWSETDSTVLESDPF